MSTDLKISQLTPATTVNTNDYTVMVDGNTSANKRATVAQILAIAGAGTVTSINVSGANGINSSGGPITSSGTIALSLGAITPTSIVASGTISGSNLSNTNTGDQAITMVGDVTAPASTGTLTATLANSVVTNDKMADMVGPTVKGRTSGTGIPQDLSTAQVTAMLPEMVADSGTGGSKGLVPPPTAGSAAAKKFLRADATWVATDLNDILPSQSGNIGKVLQTSGTTTSWQAVGVGSVTNVSVTTANGVSGSVANSSTVPAISLTLGAITPTSVNSVVVSGTSTPTLAVTGTSSISGSNTGDQTTITGNAGSATALATGRTISITGDLAYTSPSFDGSGNVTAAGTLASVASAGTTGGSTAIPIVTINAKGLTTSITTAAVIAPAGTLSGNTLASGVTASSLTSLGTIANLAVTAGTISGTPSASTDIANKLYVDTVAQGLDAKASCVAATTADITLSGTQTIDGISVIAGNRVLVKNQTLSQNNGIYLCAAGAWTRTTDADTWDELTSAFTFIETGTVNADTGYVCTANAGGTLGTTALPWSQFSGAGSYTASTGLTLTGTAFSLTTPVAVANGGTGITSLGSGIATFLGTPSSANLASAVTDETGSGSLVFATSPTLVTPILGTPTSGTLTNCTFPTLNQNTTGTAAGLSATLAVASGGTGVTTSTGSGNNVLSTSPTITSPTITGGALNGTLGATTPSTVAATTISGTGATINTTTGQSLLTLSDGGVGSYSRLNMRGGGTNLAWSFGAQDITTNALTITPSTTNGGTTFTTPIATFTSTGLNSTAIGATTPSTGAFSTLSSRFATNPATDNGGGTNALQVFTTAAQGVGVGGAISFGGATQNAGTGLAAFAQIAGRKFNATENNYLGYLEFSLNNSAGTMGNYMRLDTTGLAVTGAVTVDPSSGISIDAINNAATYALRIRRTNTTNRNWGMYVDSGGLLKFDDITGAVTPLSLSATGAAITGTLSSTSSLTMSGGTLSLSSTSSYISLHSRIAGTNNGQLLFNDGTGNNLALNETASSVYSFGTSTAGGALSLNVLSMNVSSGNVGIGTASPAATTNGMSFIPAGGGTDIPQIAVAGNSASATNYPLTVYSTSAAGYKFYVTYSGVVNAVNTTISAISDIRLKENVVTLDVGLEEIMALKPRKFDWKTGKGKDIKGDRGFIAQEFEKVFPDLIDEWQDPAPDGEEPYKSVRADLLPVIVKALQELKLDNDSLRKRLAALEAK